MASPLNTKINSYAIERGIEFDQAYTITPTLTGSLSTSGTTFTLGGSTPVYESSVGPLQGSGSWRMTGSASTGTNTLFTTTTTSELSPIHDENWTIGFWFKLNQLPGGTSTNANRLFSLTPFQDVGGFTLDITGSSVGSGNASKLAVFIRSTTDIVGTTLNTSTWNFFALRRVAGTWSIYLNGSLVGTVSNSNTSNPNTLRFGGTVTSGMTTGSWNISNYFLAPASTIDATAIQEIWTAGNLNPNISVSAAPMTASALSQDGVVTTTRSFDYQQSSIITTALQTMPTIVIINADNVQVTTSIPVDALMVSPFSVIAQVNILNQATAMTADAQLDEHIWFAGSGPLIAPLPFEASAMVVMPPFYGSGSVNVNQVSLTASAILVNPFVSFRSNYRHLVKRNTPSFYMNSPDQAGAAFLTNIVNDGYRNWGAGQGSNPTVKAPIADGKMLGVGNGRAISAVGPEPRSFHVWEFDTATAETPSNYFSAANNNYTFEFWIYPPHGAIKSSSFAQIAGASVDFGATSTEIRNEFNQITGIEYSSGSITWNQQGTVSYEHEFAIAAGSNENLLIPNQWNHIVITGQFGSYGGTNNLQTHIWINNQVKSVKVGRFVAPTSLSGVGYKGKIVDDQYLFISNMPVRWQTTEVAIYESVLSNSEISAHYTFIDSLTPNRNLQVAPMTATATSPNATTFTVVNRNFPATAITASSQSVTPTVFVAIGATWFSNALEASAEVIEKAFAGNPDATIEADELLANAELGTNVFRLDTAYFSYVKQNIAPHRYVTFDQPTSFQDQGSDNKFASAAPFVISGTLTNSNFGLTNNSLLSDGIDYKTSGLIMKESEWNDDWGTALGSYHSSFWIKRSEQDTGPVGLRIIQAAYGPSNNAFVLLYQYQNNLRFEFFNGTTYNTAQSTIGVNVFDYSKHHIVVNFRTTGVNHFAEVYVNKQLVISKDIGTQSLPLVNSTSFLPPNTEANNFARMSIGALIIPEEFVSVPVTPTATKMFIDEVHWALTSINQQQVVSLYEAMPFRNDIDWKSDVFLSLEASLPAPTFGTGVGLSSEVLTAQADSIIEPELYIEFSLELSAEILSAEAEAIEIESVFADNVTNLEFTADLFVASAEMTPAIVKITLRGPTLFASARLVEPTNNFYDEFALLVVSKGRKLVYSGLQGYGSDGYAVGDVD